MVVYPGFVSVYIVACANFVFQKQLFGIEKPVSIELTGWRKYFNSYTLQGRRNVSTRNIGERFTYSVPSGQFTIVSFFLQCVVVTYSIMVGAAAAYWIHRQNKKQTAITSTDI